MQKPPHHDTDYIMNFSKALSYEGSDNIFRKGGAYGILHLVFFCVCVLGGKQRYYVTLTL